MASVDGNDGDVKDLTNKSPTDSALPVAIQVRIWNYVSFLPFLSIIIIIDCFLRIPPSSASGQFHLHQWLLEYLLRVGTTTKQQLQLQLVILVLPLVRRSQERKFASGLLPPLTSSSKDSSTSARWRVSLSVQGIPETRES